MEEAPETAGAGRVLGVRHLRGIRVAEVPKAGLLRLSHWESLDPGMVCGITTAERGDLAVVGVPSERVTADYGELARELGFRRVSVPTQIHGTDLLDVGTRSGANDPAERAVNLAGRVDGQLANGPGWLLAATAADCVPVYLWSRRLRRVGLIHAGWRGTAGGILPRAIARFEGDPGRGIRGVATDLRVHFGPAICGRCYEVGAPVLSAFGFAMKRARLDLRGLLATQALAAGVDLDALSSSRHCTSCGPAKLHSHRASGGKAGRMAAFLGLRRH